LEFGKKEKKMETLFEEVFDTIGEALKSQGIPFKREGEAKEGDET
jgi:hypothetical protein